MAQKILNTKIREAYDTEANWMKHNPVLLAGQLAFSSDKYGKYKIGDGVAKWSQLQYMTLGWNDITGKPSSFTPSSHTHDDRYFTETEATNKFSPKEGSTSLSKLASTITLGAGDAATILQNGSTYQQKIEIINNSTSGDAVFGFYQSGDSGKNFNKLMTINDDGNVVANKFTGALAGNASSASSVPWSGITGKPSSFTPSSHSHTIANITDIADADVASARYVRDSKNNAKMTISYQETSATTFSYIPVFTGATHIGNISKANFRSEIGAATVGHTHSQYALASHTHTISQITDIGSASVKYATTAGSANAVAWANISGKPTTFNPATHSHTPSQVGLGNVNNTADANKNVNSAKYIQDSNDGVNIAISYRDQDVKTASWFPVFVTSKKIGTINGSNLRNTIGAAAKDHSHDSGISHVMEKKTGGVRYVKIADLECTLHYHRLNQQFIFTSRTESILLTVRCYSTDNTLFIVPVISYVALSLNSSLILNNLYAGLVNTTSGKNKIEIWYKQEQYSPSLNIIPIGKNVEGYVLNLYSYGSADTGSTTAPTFATSIPIQSAITWNEVTGKPTSMPASDVYSWAKASTKPAYSKTEIGLGNVDNTADSNKSVKYATSAGNAKTATNVAWSGITGKPSSFTPSSHSHTIANITDIANADTSSALYIRDSYNGKKISLSYQESSATTFSHVPVFTGAGHIGNISKANFRSVIDAAPTNHSHNTINDFSPEADNEVAISTFTNITPATAGEYDIVVANTSKIGNNKCVVMSRVSFVEHVKNHIIETFPLKAITNSQIDSLASL